jgi:hypothetical protein
MGAADVELQLRCHKCCSITTFVRPLTLKIYPLKKVTKVSVKQVSTVCVKQVSNVCALVYIFDGKPLDADERRKIHVWHMRRRIHIYYI